MFRLVTIGAEYGSGSRDVARMLAERVKWRLLDKALITEIARLGQVDPSLVERYDERVDPWFHRLARHGLWQGAFEGVAGVEPGVVFDGETMFELTRRVIQDAAEMGQCVVVGRGGQCVLQDRPDCFHVFIYAPLAFRVERVRSTLATQNPEELIKTRDSARDYYIWQHFGQERRNLHLYNLAVNTELGLETAVAIITCAIAGSGK